MVRAALVGMLTSVLLVVALPGATAGDEEYGRTWAKDKVLRAGCQEYRYQYRVKSPEYEWHLETFVLDPNKKQKWSGELHFNADRARGAATFKLCRNVATLGRYKIRGKLTYGSDGSVVWIKPGFFRLRKAS